MNSDDFERELKRRPFRAIPPEWKRNLVREPNSVSQRPARKAAEGAWFSALHELLWPSPVAWGSLTAVWIIIAALRLATFEAPTGSRVAGNEYTQLRVAMEIKREILTEPQVAMQSPPAKADKPRSHRRPKAAAV